MILTITLNPAIDMSYRMNTLELDTVNRCSNVIKTAGGKGINVTRVIRLAGKDVCATGFLGGTNGQFISEELSAIGTDHQFLQIDGNTRNCIAILHDHGKQTEILEDGPEIKQEDAIRFISMFEHMIDSYEVITASGSLAKGLPSSFYRQLISIANEKGKKFILDTSGDALKEGIEAKPFLIKPNREELSKLIGNDVQSIDDVKQAILSLKRYEIPFIVVSLGADGALGFYKDQFYKITPPNIDAVNPVGSGDSMIAGLAIAISEGFSPEKIFAYGSAFGTLNAMEEKTGYINQSLIDSFVEQTMVELL